MTYEQMEIGRLRAEVAICKHKSHLNKLMSDFYALDIDMIHAQAASAVLSYVESGQHQSRLRLKGGR